MVTQDLVMLLHFRTALRPSIKLREPQETSQGLNMGLRASMARNSLTSFCSMSRCALLDAADCT